jgi:hypothetical protein
MLAIDRSAIQIERARRRNEAHLASGRLTLEAVSLADLDVAAAQFGKVFAINVNVFWIGPASDELARVSEVLLPGGTLFLFYEAPSPARARMAAERVAAVLEPVGFTTPEILAPAPTMLCCTSRPAA